jgi:hypothetical protein
MNKIPTLVAVALGMCLMSWPALAGSPVVRVPEPMSMSLLVGGVFAIAAVKRLRRK